MRKRDFIRIIISVFAICQLLLFVACGPPPGYISDRTKEKIFESAKRAVIDFVLEQDKSLTEEDISFYTPAFLPGGYSGVSVGYVVKQRAYYAVVDVRKEKNKYESVIEYNSYYKKEISKILQEKITYDIENSEVFDNVEYEIDISLFNKVSDVCLNPDDYVPNNLTPNTFDDVYNGDIKYNDFFESGHSEWVEIKINCFSGSDNLDKTKVKEFFEEHSNGFLRKWECVEYSTDLSTCTPLDVKYITGLYGYVDYNKFEYSLKSCEYTCEKVDDNIYVIATVSNKYSYKDNELNFGPRDGNCYIIFEDVDDAEFPRVEHQYSSKNYSSRDELEKMQTENLYYIEVPYGQEELMYTFEY